jgi:UDP-2,3-diacylglucosamine pyrophosphatase LpxH
MLIFLSDFHLMDGTAGAHHVEPGVFRSTFHDLAAHTIEAEAEDVTIVFLGDLYDLIRTEAWFHVDPSQRPWGTAPSEQAAIDIFEAVVAANEETFALLSGSLSEAFGFPCEPKRVYIPGNHDSLCNHYPALRRRVRETLAIGDGLGDAPFPRHVLDLEHGVFARHGQEFDPLNFEGSEALAEPSFIPVPEEDYQRIPIGDLIACELASKIPPLVQEYLPEDHQFRARLAERMRDLYDVRPLVGMVRWLSWQVSQFQEIERNAINRAMHDASVSLQKNPFYKEWIGRHDKSMRLDEADRVQMMLELLERFRPTEYERILTWADRVTKFERDRDRFSAAAIDDFARLDADAEIGPYIYYVLYGHTHLARQRPIQVIGEPPNERYRVYFNTGTWRPTHRLLVDREGFASWKEITYTLVYRPGEIVSGGVPVPYPAVESWTGTVVVGRGRRTTVYQPIPKLVRADAE